MTWTCFMVQPVEEQEAWLRCHHSGPCPSMPGDHSYHNASAYIGRIKLSYTEDGYIESTDPSEYKGDRRWPKQCSCGHRFKREDRQVLGRQLWQNKEGERRILDMPNRTPEEERGQIPVWPAGAMFDAYWMGDYAKGPDGLHLSVSLPPDGHVWHIDGPATGGGRWTRSGTPPLISVTPSILTPKYHSFLGSNGYPPGVLGDSLPDRPLS